MSRVFVRGVGAVSPAGWGVPALRAALAHNQPLAKQPVNRPGWETPLWQRSVPAPPDRPAFLAHPRLRRTSPIAQHLVGAAVEALGDDLGLVQAGQRRVGIVVSLMAGCVNYSRRFFEEVLQSPATASPMIFPETVFNAPASHLAAFLNSSGPSYTVMGDDAAFLTGLALGANWLAERRVNACLLVGAEESDWIVADALYLFDRQCIHATGAGALYLAPAHAGPALAELALVTDAFSFVKNQGPLVAARRMREQLGSPRGANELLVESTRGTSRPDEAERLAWADWPGARLAPRTILGEGFSAAAAWQCVAAVDALQQGRCDAANVSVVGANQQAIGARFVHPPAVL